MPSTVVISSELFEYWDGEWTGQVVEFSPPMVTVAISGEKVEMESDARPGQTVTGVYVRSANQERRPVITETPPGKNLATWLFTVLQDLPVQLTAPEPDPEGWGFQARADREEATVRIVQLAPARWQIELYHGAGCGPFSWLVNNEIELFEKMWRGLLETLESTEGVEIQRQ